jgi:translation elongation factor EF-Tu-like GTPase
VNAFNYGDVLQPAGDGSIRVLARISMLSRAQGGATGPRRSEYRPNHNFGMAENRTFYIGQVEIPEGTEICPGETRDLVVEFFNVDGIAELATVGTRWRIQEGPNLVANAEVLELLPRD